MLAVVHDDIAAWLAAVGAGREPMLVTALENVDLRIMQTRINLVIKSPIALAKVLSAVKTKC